MPGRLRAGAAALWLGLLVWVAHSWFDLSGVGLLLVASSRWYRQVLSNHHREVTLDATLLERIWVAPCAVCVRSRGEPQWICRDELSAAAWAQLLRWLYRHVPTQAVGFNISR